MRDISDLENNAIKFWPDTLSDLEKESSVIPRLLETQDDFISLLVVANKGPFEWKNALPLTNKMPANLFLKHLMVLADLGGEKTMRYSKDLGSIIGDTLVFVWGNEQYSYKFNTLGESLWSNINLKVDGQGLFQPEQLSPMMEDVANLIFHAGSSVNVGMPQELLDKCILGNMIGNKPEIDKYVRQRYIWVSRITGGATSNTLGQLAQQYVSGFLNNLLPDWDFSSKTIPGVTQNERTDINFDIVARSPSNKVCAIEVSFQVTTNSVIERKAGQAKSRKDLLNALGHKIAYVIDNSGNFVRTSALSTISLYSDHIVTFKDLELESLANYLMEVEQQ